MSTKVYFIILLFCYTKIFRYFCKKVYYIIL